MSEEELSKSRRIFLKTVAAIPLAATFGLLASPLLRYLRPTLKPLDVFGASDQPSAEETVVFRDSDFPDAWTCLPFMFKQSYIEYNPEGKETRMIPGFIVKLPNGEVVAYSRICPHLGCIFNFVKDPAECAKGYNFKPDGPVFACPCHLSVYDIKNGGKVVSGPAPRPPRHFDIKKEGDQYKIVSLEAGELPNTSQTMTDGIIGSIGSALSGAVDWTKTRIGNIDIFDEHYQLEAKTNPFYALGPIFYLVWFIVIVTGCLLIIWYVPTKAAAFDSILKIQENIPFGGLIRGMHKYGADAMIIAATMRLYRMFLMADYKPGKEFNIAIGLISLLLSMYSGLTGYLLIWNQRAFWATKVFATFPTYMDQFPVMGDFYLPLVKSMHMGWNTAEALLGGGAAITQETITRFFSIHLAFSLIPLIFVELYFYKNSYKRIPLSWLKRSVIILMLVLVSVVLPAAQGHRSNPDVTPLPILSDWYFLGLYQMYKYLEPVVATEITMVIPLSVVLLPFIDVWITGPEKDIAKRPLIFMVTLMGALCWVIFSFLIIVNIANIHNDPPFWRLFLYGLIDIGVLWQLVQMWQETQIPQRLKNARAALILAVVGAVQTVVALAYYFMAKTEMFLSPLGQGLLYRFSCNKITAGDAAKQAEDLVRKLNPVSHPINQEYWNFHTLLDPAYIKIVGAPAGQDALKQLAQTCQTSTPLDFIFQLIPTFTPAPHASYSGVLDFMVTNRWLNDYLTLYDRMTPGVVAPYPLNVPDLDLMWMWLSVIVMVAGIATWWFSKKAPVEKKEVPKPAAVSSA